MRHFSYYCLPQRSMSDSKCTEGYPSLRRLSAKHRETFAFKTISERLPKILTQIIDTVHKQSDIAEQQHGKEGCEDVKAVIHQLSELRYELQTDKPLKALAWGDDLALWQDALKTYEAKRNKEATWFQSSWLMVECYLYRKIAEILKTSKFLSSFDPFHGQKEASYISYTSSISTLAKYILSVTSATDMSAESNRQHLEHAVLLSLWGNKTDLSMIASYEGYDASQDMSKIGMTLTDQYLQSLHENILADDMSQVCNLLISDNTQKQVDIVLDNAGFELFTDLCLADFLISMKLVTRVVLHCKQLPWFVSDASQQDVHWMLDQMTSSEHPDIAQLGKSWKKHISDGVWILTDHIFWTTPYEFAAMKTVAPDLYTQLQESSLVFFKGDLNYRKLVADRNWLYNTPFSESLGGFHPTAVCALRTLKADLVAGVNEDKVTAAKNKTAEWMVNGQNAVIQLHTN